MGDEAHRTHLNGVPQWETRLPAHISMVCHGENFLKVVFMKETKPPKSITLLPLTGDIEPTLVFRKENASL